MNGQLTVDDVLTADDLERRLAAAERLAEQGDRAAEREAAWLRFHLAHPEVYDELVRMTRELVSLGHRKLGVRMLWEVLRWRTLIARPTDEQYALNDHHPPHYAREIMAREPDLRGIFETRG